MLILDGFQLDSHDWTLDVNPIPGIIVCKDTKRHGPLASSGMAILELVVIKLCDVLPPYLKKMSF